MPLARTITQKLIGKQAGSAAHAARNRRFAMLLEHFPELPDMRVIDLGGELQEWLGAPARPRELVSLNASAWRHDALAGEAPAWFRPLVGDACALPAALSDERFDLVFSNSVIEHVGGHAQRIAFANSVHALADHHWIQTPNKWFPVEPHYVAPLLHLLPLPAQARFGRRWPLGSMRVATWSREWPAPTIGHETHPLPEGNQPIPAIDAYHAYRQAASIELLGPGELAFYFPTSQILRERAAGLAKSLIAVR